MMDGMNNNANNGYNRIPEEYTPLSMWAYFGYQILFAIPCVGFICLIIFALTAKNLNLRNFARSYFCVLIITLILCGVMVALGGATAILGALGNY